MSIPQTTEQTLRQYDEKIHALIDNHMQWQVKYRSDEEVERRKEILIARLKHEPGLDSGFLKKSLLTLEHLYVYSNMVMAYLLGYKLIVPTINLKLYAPVSIHRMSIEKKDLTGADLQEEDRKKKLHILTDHVADFFLVSGIITYLSKDGTPTSKLKEFVTSNVKIVRRVALIGIQKLTKSQDDSIISVGHELIMMWELNISNPDNIHVTFVVMDNLPTFYYYVDDGLNFDLHKIILDAMSFFFTSKIQNVTTTKEMRVNNLPMNKNFVADNFSVPYTCTAAARRAVFYLAILEDKSIIETENSVETFVPIQHIINVKKRKKLSVTEKRYASNLMMYVNCLNKIVDFLMTNTLLWTDKNLLTADPSEIVYANPFPIYTINQLPYSLLNVNNYYETMYKKYKECKLHLELNLERTKIVFTKSEPYDRKEFYFTMDNSSAFSETLPDSTSSPPDYCTVSTQYNKQLIHTIRQLHARLLRLELATS